MSSGVNFINVQCTAFMLVDPESAKIQLSHQYIFTLSESTSVIAVRRTLMKLTPGWKEVDQITLSRLNDIETNEKKIHICFCVSL